jgi:hypothetical protein
MPGVVAVALGGSRAIGTHGPKSDWDLGVYYRGVIDTSALAATTTVYPPGAWGRIMNGGAWLVEDGVKVDVVLRDLAIVEHWCERAEAGIYELDALLGYIAGAPTYSLMAELAVGRVIVGTLPTVDGFPSALAARGKERWTFDGQFSLDYARMHASQGNVIGVVGQVARAAIAVAHARLCEQKLWVLNEKRILERAGLAVGDLFTNAPSDVAGLDRWVTAVEFALREAAAGA